jgi:hypothetical protein
MISNENGVFVILLFDATDSWDTLLRLVYPELDRRGQGRLQTLLSSACRSVIIERHYIDKDYRDTFSHFHSKRFSTPSARCVRLHFFASAVTELEIIQEEAAVKSAYLGYAVIRPTKPNCVGRTLLCHTLRLDKQAHLSYCAEKVQLLGTLLNVEGFPFMSQDADATVCAQAALWMLLRYYSNRYPWYSEILPFQITNLASHHGTGYRVYPSAGLFSWQLAEALRMQRFSPVVYSRTHYPDFDHLLYTYIESGLPLLITLKDHVIVGYGHESDYSLAWPHRVTPLYTSYFNRSFVVSDDGHFPYQVLRSGNMQKMGDSRFRWPDIQEFIVPLPEKVFLAADQAQKAIEVVLAAPETGLASHSPSLAEKRLVFRLFLTSSRSFKRHLHKRGMGHSTVESIYRNLPMPHFIWICEIADFAEYAKSRKVLGEVIFDATRNAHEPNGWIAVHYPEKLLADYGSAFNGPQSPESIKEFPLDPTNSYSLFCSNLHSL